LLSEAYTLVQESPVRHSPPGTLTPTIAAVRHESTIITYE